VLFWEWLSRNETVFGAQAKPAGVNSARGALTSPRPGWTCGRPATRRKKPIPKSLINSDQHLERQVFHAEP
jgi:hypothetical protein